VPKRQFTTATNSRNAVTIVPTPAPLVAIDLCFRRFGKVRVLKLDEVKEEDRVAAD
jgi:hypothetical protein